MRSRKIPRKKIDPKAAIAAINAVTAAIAPQNADYLEEEKAREKRLRAKVNVALRDLQPDQAAFLQRMQSEHGIRLTDLKGPDRRIFDRLLKKGLIEVNGAGDLAYVDLSEVGLSVHRQIGQGRPTEKLHEKQKPKPAEKPAKGQTFDELIKTSPPKVKTKREKRGPRAFSDPRMPPVGTVLESIWAVNGKKIRIEVCAGYIKPRSKRPDGAAFEKARYSSFSEIMREARGLNTNGWLWFGLGELRRGELINAKGNGDDKQN